MCNQNIISNKFDLILTTTLFFILVYSDFYEIPLPALRLEKVEETHREVNDTKENNARPCQKYKSKKKKVTKDDIRRSSTATQVKDTQATHMLPEQ
jgi:hypothetical protein